ncbi:4'-phosphopantetheinyl transferase family protein [Streptomyces sp. NBC_01104]|uniref:4'-phosphopantetheinyl transferase family protein n=1 Tax=Streptomyces sp. NBC_01104 TaxID=2903750 RepID=UPI003869B68D|nr:4'-phosphopantetheinyl transferase superfamily protein [Streptomyces sp. NBC_01104]
MNVENPDVVQVWHIDLDEPSAATVHRLEQLLSPEETERRRSFAGDLARSRFTVSHGAVRLLLGHRLGVPPRAVRLRSGIWGKPEALAPRGRPAPCFSLTHSRGHALFALTGRRAVGIDLEYHEGRSTTALAARHFPAAEGAAVRRRGPHGGPLFVRLWTRKEACVKAVGARLAEGLALPTAGTGPGLLVSDPAGRLPGPWRVRDLTAPAGCGAAVALAGAAPYRVIEYRFAPAEHDGGAELPAGAQTFCVWRHAHED